LVLVTRKVPRAARDHERLGPPHPFTALQLFTDAELCLLTAICDTFVPSLTQQDDPCGYAIISIV
jgi:hypothetical protein